MSFKNLVGGAGFLLLMAASSAWANTAANTQITNNAVLTFNDGAGTQTATAAVTVSVALVASPPTFSVGGPQSTSYSAAAFTTDSYTLTATANGPDTYDLSATPTAVSNTTLPTATPVVASIYLGATITALGSTTTDIFVPSDGKSDNKVNGIAKDAIVVINNEQRTVTSVTDSASGISHIILNAPLSAAPAAGIIVAERATVNVTVTPGTITTVGTNVVVNAKLTATSATVASVSDSSANILNTFTSGAAGLTKFVRNTTTPNHTATCTDAPSTYGGSSFYAQCVTAKPGDVLEYMLVTTTTATGSVSGSAISDLLPVDYVSLKTAVSDTQYGGKDIVYVDEANAVHPLTAAADTDAATYNATFDQTTINAYKGKLTVNIGAGATSALGGTITPASTVRVLYQVTVKP